MVEFHSVPRDGVDVEDAVRARYSAAARALEPALCCPVDYRPETLEHIPAEILERDYGCGDPSRFVAEGETVLDLGSGGGKICYIAAKNVGPRGRVIGIDANDAMLALARKYREEVAARLGFSNVEFRKGKIQDLQLDLDRLDAHLAENPVRSSTDWLKAETHAETLRRECPLIPDGTIDVIVSNCVLNLVRQSDRRRLFAEMHRVLKPGGRAVVSDIVADRDVPEALRNDPHLWSGCISGAFEERQFAAAFAEAGFDKLEVVARQAEPWTIVEGIEFRSVTVRAHRGEPRRESHDITIVPLSSSSPATECCGPSGCC
ncbi:MAG: methyltransferase domain-containing protein [Planctomycetaceae bacterium]